MGKKIKDLTLGELVKICESVGLNSHKDKDCRNCPIHNYCLPPLGTSNRPQPSIVYIDRDLNKDIWWEKK